MKKFKLSFRNDPITFKQWLAGIILPILSFLIINVIKGEIYWPGLTLSMVVFYFIMLLRTIQIKKIILSPEQEIEEHL